MLSRSVALIVALGAVSAATPGTQVPDIGSLPAWAVQVLIDVIKTAPFAGLALYWLRSERTERRDKEASWQARDDKKNQLLLEIAERAITANARVADALNAAGRSLRK